MFNWFKKNKNKNEVVEAETKKMNYQELDNGDIYIYWQEWNYDSAFYWMTHTVIPKSSISVHTEDTLVFERKDNKISNCSYGYAIDNKVDYVMSERIFTITCRYDFCDNYWDTINMSPSFKELYRKSPFEVFTEEYKSQYKLIETEDEFNDYLASTLDCNTWCRRKLYNKMKEVGLGDGFINEFADLIGNDLDKYHAMIDLAGEVSDKDTLMYLYTYKFGKR